MFRLPVSGWMVTWLSAVLMAALRRSVFQSGRVVAELDDPGDVEHVVDAAVPGAGEPVAGVLPAGGIDGGGAVPRGELAAVREPAEPPALASAER